MIQESSFHSEYLTFLTNNWMYGRFQLKNFEDTNRVTRNRKWKDKHYKGKKQAMLYDTQHRKQ